MREAYRLTPLKYRRRDIRREEGERDQSACIGARHIIQLGDFSDRINLAALRQLEPPRGPAMKTHELTSHGFGELLRGDLPTFTRLLLPSPDADDDLPAELAYRPYRRQARPVSARRDPAAHHQFAAKAFEDDLCLGRPARLVART